MDTLLSYPDIVIEQCRKRYGINISSSFMVCADLQLTPLFELQTGLKVNKQISISWVQPEDFFYLVGDISKLPFQIYVNHNWNPVTFCWKSKSGRIYDIADTDIDCNDIEFWFDGLDPALYHKQLYPKEDLPFKLKNLDYELVVTRLNLDCTIKMQLKKGEANAAEITEQIDDFIGGFNDKSLKKDRKYGVIHNWKSRVEGNTIIYDLDLGSVGMLFFKKLLVFLSGLQCFNRVEIV